MKFLLRIHFAPAWKRSKVSHHEMMPNIQYSIENGRVGLDWVLEAPQNIKDQTALADFIKRNGYTVLRNDTEDVPYLRVEGEGVADLGVKILCEFYHMQKQTKVTSLL